VRTSLNNQCAFERSALPPARMDLELALRGGLNRIAALGLDDQITLTTGSNSLVANLSRATPLRDEHLAALQEISLVTNQAIRIEQGNKNEIQISRSNTPVLMPDWIQDSYEVEQISSSDSATMIRRALLLNSRARTNSKEVAGKISDLIQKENLPIAVTSHSGVVTFTVTGSRITLGQESFRRFLSKLEGLELQGCEVQGVFHPASNTALKHFFDLSSGQRAPGPITANEKDRTIHSALRSSEITEWVSDLLYRDTGWKVESAPAIDLPEEAPVLIVTEPQYSPQVLEPATERDLNQIGWAIPGWLLSERPVSVGRFVVAGVPRDLPSNYRERLQERLERTGVPTIVVRSNTTKKLRLDLPKLDQLVQQSLPSDCSIRDVSFNDQGVLQISLFASGTSSGEVDKLQNELSDFLRGAKITDRSDGRRVITTISEVEVQTEAPSPRLSRMFQRVGPVFGDFAARVCDSDGFLRVDPDTSFPDSQKKINSHFKRVVFPFQNYPAEFSSPRVWTNHTGQAPEKIEARTAYAIDSAGTRFCEDAFSAEPDQDGGWIVTAHIARVSRFVVPGSDLDEFSRRRVLAVYPRGGGEVIWNLPRKFLLENVGYDDRSFRPSWTFKIKISAEGELVAGSLKETTVRVRNQISFSRADDLLMNEDASESLKALQRAALAYSIRNTDYRGSSRLWSAREMIESCLRMTEEITLARFSEAEIDPFGPRMSGAGRDLGRLITQYQMEQAHGYLRPISEEYIQHVRESLGRHSKPGYMKMREKGAEFIGGARNLSAYIHTVHRGALKVSPDRVTLLADNRNGNFVVDPDSFEMRGGDDPKRRRIYPVRTPGESFRDTDRVTAKVTGLDLVTAMTLVELVRQ